MYITLDIKKFALRIVLFGIILLPVLFISGKFYDAHVMNKTDEKPLWILSKRNEKFDYAVIGSSRAFNNFSIRLSDSLLSKRGINLGISASGYPQSLFCLDQFYKNGNEVDLLLIQTDIYNLVNPDSVFTYPFMEFNYFHLLGKSNFSDSIFKANTSPSIKYYFRKYVPFFKYAEFNNKFPVFHTVTSFKYMMGEKKMFDAEMGSLFYDTQNKDKVEINEKNIRITRTFNTDCINSLRALISLAAKHNTKVILYTAPILKEYLVFEPSQPAAVKLIKNISKDFRIEYFNFAPDSLLNDKSYFYDYTHLNRKGVMTFTRQFALTLKEQYYGRN